MILVLKDKLRKGNLSIEKEENLLDDKFEAMKDICGWKMKGKNMHWSFENPNLRNHLKGNMDIMAYMAIKQLIVMREKLIKKRRILVVFFNLQNR